MTRLLGILVSVLAVLLEEVVMRKSLLAGALALLGLFASAASMGHSTAAVAAVLLLSPGEGAQVVYDAGEDLVASEVSCHCNPTENGIWSFGYRAALSDSALTLFPDTPWPDSAFGHTDLADYAGLQGWQGAVANSPATTVNTLTTTIPVWLGLNPGEMLVHPGPVGSASRYAVVRWSAPVGGSADVWANWRVGHSNPVGVHVVVNGVEVFGSVSALEGTGYQSPTALTVAAGDTIDFVVGGGGNWPATSTFFFGTVTLGPQRSPTERLTALIEQVEQLADNGVLNPGQANSLINKLEAAIASIERGNINAAQNQLFAFVREVEAQTDGQSLIDEAHSIWDQLNEQ